MALLRRAVLVWIVAGIAMVTLLVVAILWWAGTRGLKGAELVTARLDALRTGLTIGLGGGGLFALYLAWRRQHSTEIGIAQKQEDQLAVARAYDLQERTAQAGEADAAARRITDLYTKAVELLGSDQAPVRLGGLYALERLAQDNPDQRPTITSVLCAYLRMPFPPPTPLPEDATNDQRQQHADHERAHDEQQQVRDTALEILRSHRIRLQDPSPQFWNDITINLSGANLTGANLSYTNLGHADLFRADLTNAYLAGAYLVDASLSGANLTDADLTDANLTRATLINTNLTDANLTRAKLAHAYLTEADLTRDFGDTGVQTKSPE